MDLQQLKLLSGRIRGLLEQSNPSVTHTARPLTHPALLWACATGLQCKGFPFSCDFCGAAPGSDRAACPTARRSATACSCPPWSCSVHCGRLPPGPMPGSG